MRSLADFLRKDVLLQVRDYKELAVLLLMPVILIAILALALGQLITGGPAQLDIRAALVVEDDPAAGHAEFLARLGRAELPLPQRLALTAAAAAVRPVELVRSVLTSPGLSELLSVEELPAPEARARLEADEAQAVVTLPPGFTAALLGGMLLGEGGGTIDLALSDASPLRAGIVRDVMDGFAREVSFRSALSQVLQGPPPAAPEPAGAVEELTVGGRLSSVTFYTFGMAVMFALFVAGSVSSRAHLERANLTFDRIIMSGARPLAFLLSKALAGGVVVFLQMAFLFVAATLLLGALRGQPLGFWLAAAAISAALALAVGALGALVTAVNFRANNQALSNVFNSVAVTLLAVLGGSFFPISDTGSLIARVGGWTPNGAALNGYMDAAKGLGAAAYGGDLVRLLVVGLLLLAAAAALFPRRKVG